MEIRAAAVDRRDAQIVALEKKLGQTQLRLDDATRDLQRARSERDDAVVASRKAAAQERLAADKVAHMLKRETQARERAEAVARKAVAGAAAEPQHRAPSAQSRAEFKQRVAFQDETMAAATEHENAQLRLRLKWVATQLSDSTGIREQAWQLPLDEFDRQVVPHLQRLLSSAPRASAAAVPMSAPVPAAASENRPDVAATATSLADGRRRVRALENDNAALRARVAELTTRIGHREQMLDYTIASATAHDPVVVACAAAPLVVAPDAARAPASPLATMHSNTGGDSREAELFDFFSSLSPMRK